ncbi:hypothetical protein NPIL_6291 [Nephila pilipes]|uniref:Uncharacterized protein n=1 Tax=Nephila pilipes TaxID=299642 RepID=A0A8X6QVQ3_NEPPI|nr:hypothetical protein NPIL_6291 [Nephila pilipes]
MSRRLKVESKFEMHDGQSERENDVIADTLSKIEEIVLINYDEIAEEQELDDGLKNFSIFKSPIDIQARPIMLQPISFKTIRN